MNETTSTKSASLKGWIVLAVILSISFDYAVSDNYSIRIPLKVFFPLITAVIAHRFGMRVFDFLFLLAIPAILGAGGYLTARFGIEIIVPPWSFMLSVVTAFAFCRPAMDISPEKLLNRRWHWSRWLVLLALWLMLHSHPSFEFDVGENMGIRIGAGAILMLVAFAISVRWDEVRLQFGKILSLAKTKSGYYARLAIVFLISMAMLVNVSVDFDYYFSIYFGFSDGLSWLLVFAFCAVAFGAVDWRIALVIVTVLIVSESSLWRAYEFIETLLVEQTPTEAGLGDTDTDSMLEEIVVSGSRMARQSLFWTNLIYAYSFILVAVALQPCLDNRNPMPLRSRRSLGFLTLSTVAIFLGVPLLLIYLIGPAYLSISALAFAIGYRWRIRGILLGPIILQLAYIVCAIVFARPNAYPTSALLAIDIGLIGFTAAFFGMLLSRYVAESDDAELVERRST